MPPHRCLNRIGNDLPTDQRGFHPLVAHGDAVGDGDGVEPARHAARFGDAQPRHIRLRIERGVARRAVIPGGGNPDEGP